ncbi:MAG: hypothetical protein QXR05_11065 [Candidatus Methanomethylicia archaeon]
MIRRSELLLSLDFLEGYDAELMDLNSGKVGCLFKITGRYVEFPHCCTLSFLNAL